MQGVATENICKMYGAIKALDDISFDIPAGSLFGFIGPDGAGKTTLFRILTTVLKADKGTAEVCSLDVEKDYKKIRQIAGYMPGRFSLYQDLSVEENLRFFATIFGTTIKENYELIKDIYVQLEPFKNRRAGKLSGGMKQKLALCCALIHKPQVLFLDEPTTGVDPVSRKEFWEILKELKTAGITILVSTPYMDEAERCDKVALMQEGKILSIDTPAAITKQFPYKLFSIYADEKYKLLRNLQAYQFTNTVYLFGDSFHYTDKRENIDKEMLQDYLQQQGFSHLQISQIDATIEDSFMELMHKDKVAEKH